MLEFFRKYQRFIFILVTAVIILSFSFFGTYNTLSTGNWREEIAFRAVDGTEVTRAEEEEMALFLATDADDKAYYGGVWGPNFLNDGVVKKDFLATGLAAEVVAASPQDFQEDLAYRLTKEKLYHPYQHPGADFLSAMAIWTYFAPDIPRGLKKLSSQEDPTSLDAFQTRANLYLAERQFPPYLLRQFLLNQQKQYSWITPDPQLPDLPLSLFNYRGFEDWFGPKLHKKIARFIIQASLIAEANGESVSKTEALNDLLHRAKESFSLYRNTKNLGVTTPAEYFQEQLRLLNIDQTRAVRLWRQVLLFRKYFQNQASQALQISNQSSVPYLQIASRLALYQLPKELRLGTVKAWEELEFYLAAVAPPIPSMDMPKEFLSTKEISALYPELTQRRFVLEIQELPYKKLLSKIVVKDVLEWQLSDAHWTKLEEQFRSLSGQGKDPQTRLEALQNLDRATKMQVDVFTKEQILQQHPSLQNETLQAIEPSTKTLYVRSVGGKEILPGTAKQEVHQQLVSLLEGASVGVPPDAGTPLHTYSPNQKDLYRITVKEKGELSLVPFWEAKKEGVLETIKPRLLEQLYKQNRSLYSSIKKNEKQPFSTVVAQVEEEFLLQQQKQLQEALKQVPHLPVLLSSREEAAKFRLFPYLYQTLSALKADKASEEFFVRRDPQAPSSAQEQWKLLKETVTVQSSQLPSWLSEELLSSLKPQEWSLVMAMDGGNAGFIQMEEQGPNVGVEFSSQEALLHQQRLEFEAKRTLTKELLQKMQTIERVHVGE